MITIDPELEASLRRLERSAFWQALAVPGEEAPSWSRSDVGKGNQSMKQYHVFKPFYNVPGREASACQPFCL